ncbi:unnamed protein product, partial [Didymodactylos carnosus]
MSIVVT